mmetsp:Transcript_14145/g.50336  ORF Transcript_14145/g.50336 Transcript_14145/m.50336 type:complete len:371 (+) Transcript_14145:164-1276(+)
MMRRGAVLAAMSCVSCGAQYTIGVSVDGEVRSVGFSAEEDLIEVAALFVQAQWPLATAECPVSMGVVPARNCVTWHVVNAMLAKLAANGIEAAQGAVAFAQSKRYGWAGAGRAAGDFAERRFTADDVKVAAWALATDKVWQHGYDRAYWRYLPPADKADVSILELGAGAGGSAKMWRRLYPTALIVALTAQEADEFPDFNGAAFDDGVLGDDLLTMIVGDCSSVEDLRKCAAATDGYDLVVDDASHMPDHQLLAFAVLFPSVKPGGAYIIEDVETSFWRRDQGLYGYLVGDTSVIDVFRREVDVVNREVNGAESQFGFDVEIESIIFASNAIIVTRALQADAQHFSQRKYLYADRTIPQSAKPERTWTIQ